MLEISEKQKIIARFMGLIPNPYDNGKTWAVEVETIDSQVYGYNWIKLFYYTSWDYLMPVVEKINRFDWVQIMSGECKIHAMQPDQFRTIRIIKEEEPLINSVFEACFQYAEWFLSSNNA